MKTITPIRLTALTLGSLVPWFLGSLAQAESYISPLKPPALTISYDMSGMPLTITHDGAGVYGFDGLPYPGTVIYTPENSVIYYQHPEDPLWHTITPAMLKGVMVPAAISQGPVAKPWQQHTNIRWNITAPQTSFEANPNSPLEGNMAQAPKVAACPPMFGSPAASHMAGLDVSDITYVLTTLQWLNAGAIVNGCEKLQFTAKQAEHIGLPTNFTGPNGVWQLQEIVQTSTSLIPLPNAAPINDATRLRLLLAQFGPEDRADLMRQYGNLPTQQQIELISPMLTQETVVP